MNVSEEADEEANRVDVVGEDTTEYPVMLEPPSSDAPVHVIVADVLLADTKAIPIVGLPGVVNTLTTLLNDE